MEKRGQFYLIAAVIIIAMILAFVAISNYYKTKSSVQIEDLKKELEIESSEVLDYVIQTLDTDRLDTFTKDFSEYAGNQVEIIFITDALGTLEVYRYEGGIKTEDVVFNEGENSVTITFNGFDYEFTLTEGIDFYFIISQTIGGEQHVVTN